MDFKREKKKSQACLISVFVCILSISIRSIFEWYDFSYAHTVQDTKVGYSIHLHPHLFLFSIRHTCQKKRKVSYFFFLTEHDLIKLPGHKMQWTSTRKASENNNNFCMYLERVDIWRSFGSSWQCNYRWNAKDILDISSAVLIMVHIV